MRLNQKHSRNVYEDRQELDVARIYASQSFRRGLVAAMLAIVVMTLLSMALQSLFGRVFPWLILVQGALVGIAIKRWGRGFDWRFPVLGGASAFFGAYIHNILLAGASAAAELDVSTITVLLNMSEYTLSTYFAEDLNPADHIFAVFAAAFGAFFARRQLSRDEYRAVRLAREPINREHHNA